MEKLKSRKLWLSAASFVSMIVIFTTGNHDMAVQITALIMAGGGTMAYILGQSWCDGKAIENDNKKEDES